MPIETVLVPGLLCSPRLYEPVLPALWGFGATTVADTRHDDSIKGIAARLLAATTGRFALVGLSMGGYIALEVMRQAPERVLALALLSTSARPDTQAQSAARREQMRTVQEGQFDELVEVAFPLIVDPSNAQDDRLRSTWHAMAGDVGPDAFCRQQAATIARRDARPLLDGIGCPTLVVHGTGDQLIAADHAQELADLIPDARLTLLERCGHSPTWERPEDTTRALTSLLSSIAETP